MLATAPRRDLTIKKDTLLCRAQLGVDEEHWTDDEGVLHMETVGLSPDRMVPKRELVRSGRANPPGIAYLYLASTELVAVSEMRPWIGAGVSVAQFKVVRELRALDLTKGHGGAGLAKLTIDQLLGKAPVNKETKRRAVWTDIDSAFSRPVSREEESIDYVPTQILAEAFRDVGYEAIVYRSSFDNPGYNIVLFDISDAELRNCTPYKVKSLTVGFVQDGNTRSMPDQSGVPKSVP